MNKIQAVIALVILTFSLLILPVTVLAQEGSDAPAPAQAESVDVYAEFWPVVPGTTVADPMFWAKQVKEGLSGLFSFGNVNRAQYQIGLSEKRFVEAYKLFEDKDFGNFEKSLGMNADNRKQALEYKRKAAEEGSDVLELSKKLVSSLEKQQKAVMFLETQVPEEQKGRLEKVNQELTLQISEAR